MDKGASGKPDRAGVPSGLSPASGSQAKPLIPSADLEAAIRIALCAHAGQTDKAGQPYILHPLRVMLAGTAPADRIAGVLHDVVEDSAVTVEYLRDQFGDEIADAVDALTKRRTETYTGFILRCGANALARRVKMRDLADNMDLARLPGEPTQEDARRQQKYTEALGLLRSLSMLAYRAAQGGVTEGRDGEAGSGSEATSTRSPEGGCAQ